VIKNCGHYVRSGSFGSAYFEHFAAVASYLTVVKFLKIFYPCCSSKNEFGISRLTGSSFMETELP
jgi:hypothetical protein